LFQQIVNDRRARWEREGPLGDCDMNFKAVFHDGEPVNMTSEGLPGDSQIAAGRAALDSATDESSESCDASQSHTEPPRPPARVRLDRELARIERQRQAVTEAAERHPPTPKTGPPDAREKAKRWRRLFGDDDGEGAWG
jgi:hypothetical protein